MVTIIVAMGRNNGIGKQNEMLWHLPKDLQHFKNKTSGHPVIMGRKTYESIGKPLPGRTNIVVSRRENWFCEGILIVGSLKEALKHAKKINPDIFVIGGANIYSQAMEKADRLKVTRVDAQMDADAFFPKIDAKIWAKTTEEFFAKDEKNAFDMSFESYERIEDLSQSSISKK